MAIFNAPPSNPSDDPGAVAADVRAALSEFQAAHGARLATLDARVESIAALTDTMARNLGRLTVGGGGTEIDANANRLRVFNATMRHTRGGVSDDLSGEQWREYQSALSNYFRYGQSAIERPGVQASLSVGSDPEGGYTVIPTRDPQPRERLFRTSPMRALADVIDITSGTFEGVHETSEPDCGWVGETEARPETDGGKLAAFKIDADEVYANVPLTQRLLDDSSIDIGAYVESRMDRRFRRAENSGFVNGDGTKKPRGFLHYAAAAVTDADATRPWGKLQYVVTGFAGGFPKIGATQADNPNALFDVKAALHAELRADAVWAMNSATFALVEKLKDAEGRFLVRQSLDGASPDRLIGYPVVIFEDMPDPSENSFSIAFGNFGIGYQIIDKPGIRVLRDPYTTKGRVKFYGYKRTGGDVVNFDAIKLLKFGTA